MERRCHKSVLSTGIKNLQTFKFLSKSLRCESDAENQTREQYSRIRQDERVKTYH